MAPFHYAKGRPKDTFQTASPKAPFINAKWQHLIMPNCRTKYTFHLGQTISPKAHFINAKWHHSIMPSSNQKTPPSCCFRLSLSCSRNEAYASRLRCAPASRPRKLLHHDPARSCAASARSCVTSALSSTRSTHSCAAPARSWSTSLRFYTSSALSC